MQTRSIVAALALAAGFAGQAFAEAPQYSQSGTSRAAVSADYIASRDQVRAMTGEDSGSAYLAQSRANGQGASRAAATTDYIASRDQVRALTGEDSGSAYLAQHRGNGRVTAATLAGQPVRAE